MSPIHDVLHKGSVNQDIQAKTAACTLLYYSTLVLLLISQTYHTISFSSSLLLFNGQNQLLAISSSAGEVL